MVMVISDFNLLVSTPRTLENDACSEIWFLLNEIGDHEPVAEKTGITGLVAAKTMLDPLTVVKELRKMLKNRPEEFRYMLRVVPVEVVVSTKLEDIKKASLELSARIGEDETFRVTAEKRHTTLSSKEIVKAVAEGIDRKVDLLKPNKIVLIEVLGGLTGVSVIEPDDILSVVKEKSQLNLRG
jgi:tRNA acetyltransferase TAN1